VHDDDSDGHEKRGQLDFFPKLAGFDELELFGTFGFFDKDGRFVNAFRFRFDPLDGRLGRWDLVYADEFAGFFERMEGFRFVGRGRDYVVRTERSIEVLFVDRGYFVERRFHNIGGR